MSVKISQITGISTVCSTDYLDSLERKHQSPHYRAVSYYSDLTLSQEFKPMAAQLSKKAAPPLAKFLRQRHVAVVKQGPGPLKVWSDGFPCHDVTMTPASRAASVETHYTYEQWWSELARGPTAIGHYDGCRCPRHYISNNLTDSIIIIVSHSIRILTVSMNKPG